MNLCTVKITNPDGSIMHNLVMKYKPKEKKHIPNIKLLCSLAFMKAYVMLDPFQRT